MVKISWFVDGADHLLASMLFGFTNFLGDWLGIFFHASSYLWSFMILVSSFISPLFFCMSSQSLFFPIACLSFSKKKCVIIPTFRLGREVNNLVLLQSFGVLPHETNKLNCAFECCNFSNLVFFISHLDPFGCHTCASCSCCILYQEQQGKHQR